ncbi:MAG TPA: FKBP-type peptidyl-prolyl cis-trans isomerase [Candidatus Angelobacter sp.]|nr:FKBP-type peptidyl-prolyl cis-trans isomerase [Candidatus Angelobacter sp.]
MKKIALELGCIAIIGAALLPYPAAAQSGTQAKPAASKAAPAKTPAATQNTADSASQATDLKDDKQKVSYALGMNLGNNLRKQSVDVDPNVLVLGLKDALAGNKTAMTEQDAQATLMQWQKALMAKQEEKMKQAATKNKQEGEAFLAANKTKEGVIALPSGLQYKILQPGTGAKPTAADTVVCNYRGTLIDGTEFDSSYKRGEPASFPVGGVIKGWTEALQLMPTGSKWQLFIPSELAYGERGAGSDIGPNATLIFEVEMISIKK